MIAAIINVIGVGLLGGVGFFMQRLYVKFDVLDKKIDGLEEKIDKKFEVFEEKIDKKFEVFEERFDLKLDGLEARLSLRIDGLEARIEKLEVKADNSAAEFRSELASLKVAVGKIEFTLTHHSAQLEQIMSYGERIGRLERAVFGAET